MQDTITSRPALKRVCDRCACTAPSLSRKRSAIRSSENRKTPIPVFLALFASLSCQSSRYVISTCLLRASPFRSIFRAQSALLCNIFHATGHTAARHSGVPPCSISHMEDLGVVSEDQILIPFQQTRDDAEESRNTRKDESEASKRELRAHLTSTAVSKMIILRSKFEVEFGVRKPARKRWASVRRSRDLCQRAHKYLTRLNSRCCEVSF
jgi:hypothetical protein